MKRKGSFWLSSPGVRGWSWFFVGFFGTVYKVSLGLGGRGGAGDLGFSSCGVRFLSIWRETTYGEVLRDKLTGSFVSCLSRTPTLACCHYLDSLL